jgi:hypothetical protein
MSTFGDMIGETATDALQRQKMGEQSNTFKSVSNAVVSAIRPDQVATIPSDARPETQADIDKRNAASEGTKDDVLDVLKVIEGKIAQVQLEAILGEKVDARMPLASKMFDQMGILTDVGLLLASVGIGVEVGSLGQIDKVTDEIRHYLDYSGVTQITSYGYGTIMGEMLGEPLTQELKGVMQHSLLSTGDLITAQMRRSTYNPSSPKWDDDLYDQVRKYGLSPEKAQMMLDVNAFYPSVQDWLSFQVRDVFNPDAVARGGYDTQFPETILPFTRKAGITDEMMKYYWRAHWQLPSPNVGYQMFHRELISESDLKSLLLIADWSPGWIDNLMALSYEPLTRIDARRMLAAGIISLDEFTTAMRHLGYSPEDAQRLSKLAEPTNKPNAKDLTAAQKKEEYDLGLISHDEYTAFLVSTGYTEEEAQELVTLYKSQADAKDKVKRIAVAVKRYKKMQSDEAGISAELGSIGVSNDQILRIIDEAKIERKTPHKYLDKADVEALVKKGMITESEAVDRLVLLEYSPDDAQLLVALALSSTSTSG